MAAVPLDDLLEDTEDPLASAMAGGAEDLPAEFDFDSHVATMDDAINALTHGSAYKQPDANGNTFGSSVGLGQTDAAGTLKQFGDSTGLGATMPGGVLKQDFGGINGAAQPKSILPKPTVYPTLQNLGPRRDLRFQAFEQAKTALTKPGITMPVKPEVPVAEIGALASTFPKYPANGR